MDVEKAQGSSLIKTGFSGFIFSLQASQASFFLQTVIGEAEFFKKRVDFYIFLTIIEALFCINKH